MNYGILAKKFAYAKGFNAELTPDDGVDFGEGNALTPARLDKANVALDKLREQTQKRWKLVEKKKKKSK